MKNNSFLFFILGIHLFTLNSLAQKKNDSFHSYYKLYTEAKNDADLLESHQYFTKHKDSCIKSNNIMVAIIDLRYMSSIEYRLGLFNESEETSVENLKLIDQLSDSIEKNTQLVGVYNHIGIINRKLMNYDRAIEMYKRSLSLTTDKNYIHTLTNNIGNIYKYKGKYKLAYIELSKSKNYFKFPMDTIQYARALSNLALVKSKLSTTGAFEDLIEAYRLKQMSNNKLEMFDGNIDLGEYYLDIKQKEKAKTYFEKAYNIATELNGAQDRIFSLSRIIDCGDISKVYTYKSLRDSIEQVNYKIAYKFASQKYDYSEENRKRIQSELGREKEQQAKLIYFFLLIIATILAVLYSFYQRSNHRKNIINKVHTTENRIAKKLHDEVANDLYQNMVKLQNNPTDPTVLDDLENIYIKTRDISKQNNALNFDESFKELFQDLILTYKDETVNIVINNFSKINWNTISEIKKTIIHRVVQELLTNMKKHSKASLVVLSFKKLKNKLIIQYTDNGTGCLIKKRGGLFHTENRIQSIGGTITFESKINKGFKATINI